MYLIGIDAGGTKSELVAYDLNYNPIYKRIGGFGNPAVNLDKTINNIISLIYECTEELGKENCMLIAVGMAAVETGNYTELIKKYIEGAFVVETIIMNDAEMACKAYFGNEDGILAISGTGSSCYAQKNQSGEMIGGWSHILGDEGSGYHTVIQIFKKITYNIDRNIPLDNLSRAILEAAGGASRSDIMDFIYNNNKDKISSLFPIITDFAKKNDSHAIMLLENAGKYLAELTLAAYKKKNFNGKIKVGLKGGVFYNSNNMLSAYVEELRGKMEFDIIKDNISATKAVCNIYNDK